MACFWRQIFVLSSVVLSISSADAQVVTVDTSPSGRQQVIDGFGTCLAGAEAEQAWWQALYYDDLQASILRLDLTPPFKGPYSDNTYNSPWYHNNPPLPGPDNNNVRAYTNGLDYTRTWSGRNAQIAVMGPNINQNTNYFNMGTERARVAIAAAKAGAARSNALGGFKLVGSLWSPAPWVKISSGNTISGHASPLPLDGAAWPFIWYDNFSGGKLDTSGTALSIFNDSAQGGSGNTSALTQFARCTAAYLRALQKAAGVNFHAISIQNELNFEEFYNSCTYPLSAGYITALKTIRAELDKYPDLATIRLMGPEDLMGDDAYGLWQYGGGSSTVHKNLQYLQNISADSQAAAALAWFCIHGYAADGVNAANATPTQWNWWASGWGASPAAGIPANVKGFTYYNKKSWMTETSGENPAWISPAGSYPNKGAWSVALRIHQALTTGRQSAWIYWQATDGSATSQSTLTSSGDRTNAAKYVAAKHYFRYVRPDAVRVNAGVSGSTNLLASAFLHDTNRTLTVVLLNTSSNALTATINVPSQPFVVSSFKAFTSKDADLWRASGVGVTNGAARVVVPGYGVATLYGVAAPVLTAAYQPTNQLRLTWGQASLGFKLQASTNLTSSTVWTTLTNTPAITNGLATVNVPINATRRCYRLILP